MTTRLVSIAVASTVLLIVCIGTVASCNAVLATGCDDTAQPTRTQPRPTAPSTSSCGNACPAIINDSAASSQAAGCLDGGAVLVRAATWLHAWNGGPVPYLSSSDPT